jgi:hypothetical protein
MQTILGKSTFQAFAQEKVSKSFWIGDDVA